MRPQIGFAVIKLLEQSGCVVKVPVNQTCCGQPAYNSGDNKDSIIIARQVINAFECFDYVVVPSGSCAAMIRIHYPELFINDDEWRNRAERLAAKTYELSCFLAEIREFSQPVQRLAKTITYHDSCTGYRELGIYTQPRQLLKNIQGLEINEMNNSTECCGFGGTFCVKYPDISNAIVSDKTRSIEDSNADILVGGDYGCLMNISGKMNRQGSRIDTFHIAEVLAGMADPDGNDDDG